MATCEITLTGETIGTVARTSQERRQRQPAGGLAARPTTEPTAPKLNGAPRGDGLCSAPSCAACWIRTCVHGAGPGLPGAVVYESPAPEFRLYRFTLTGEQTELSTSGPRIALCTDGGALLRNAGGTELKLQHSESCFLSDADGMVTVTGEGAVFVATVG